MARTEVREVIKVSPRLHREPRGMGHGYYARPADQQPPQVVIDRSAVKHKELLTLQEGQEIYDARQALGVRPRDLDVRRVQIITRRDRHGQVIEEKEQDASLNTEQKRSMVYYYPEVAGSVMGKEMYKAKRKEEKRERKQLGKGPNFFWGLTLAKAFVRPVPTLKHVAAGLISEKHDAFALNQIQDAVRTAIQLNFPEYRNRAVHEVNGLVKLLRWGPIPYITSLFPHADFLIDLGQDFNDISMGKREQRMGRAGLATAIDFTWTPGFNLGMMHEGMDRMDNRIIKGELAYARDALSNPNSPFAHKKMEVAQAILGANSLDHHINSQKDLVIYGFKSAANKVSNKLIKHDIFTVQPPQPVKLLAEDISLAEVNQRIADHEAEVSRMNPDEQKAQRKSLHERKYTLNWQKEVAEVIEMARMTVQNAPQLN